MSQARLKIEVAQAALAHVDAGMVLGVGTGSTVNAFMDALATAKIPLKGAVSSSDETTARLNAMGVDVLDLNHTGDLSLYIDGADEVDGHRRMIKGGGGALTREKIIAAAAREFICIVDETKCVNVLGEFPVPVEVIPMARAYVARQLVALGGQPALRDGITTDNGHLILDVRGLDLVDPVSTETAINQIAGVVSSGIFARRGADRVLVATETGVESR